MLGGHAVAQCVRNEGVRHIFCVPGESHIAVIDGLINTPDIKLITNRQEGCAAFMAEGYAKSTRKVGVCLVTRGPGATNASIAIHSAKYDSDIKMRRNPGNPGFFLCFDCELTN